MIYSIRLPLQKDSIGLFFDTNNSIEEHIVHLLNNIIYTRKNEYLMNYEYGIGIQDNLFENINYNLKNTIKSEINYQLKKFLKEITVKEIMVYDSIDYQKGSILAVVSEYYSKYFDSQKLNDNELLISIIYDIVGRDENTKMLSAVLNF